MSYKINLSIIEKRKSLMTRMEKRAAASMKSEKSKCSLCKQESVAQVAENSPRMDERSMLTI